MVVAPRSEQDPARPTLDYELPLAGQAVVKAPASDLPIDLHPVTTSTWTSPRRAPQVRISRTRWAPVPAAVWRRLTPPR